MSTADLIGTARQRPAFSYHLTYDPGQIMLVKSYYHLARPHQGLDGDTPLPSNKPMRKEHPTKLVSIPICGGLHHRYERVVA